MLPRRVASSGDQPTREMEPGMPPAPGSADAGPEACERHQSTCSRLAMQLSTPTKLFNRQESPFHKLNSAKFARPGGDGPAGASPGPFGPGA